MAPTASAEEIRAAYRALARRLHPDARGGRPSPEMAAVNEAWRVLSDPGRRAVYDAGLRGAPGRTTAGAAPAPDPADTDDDWRAWVDDETPLSPREARASERLHRTVMMTVVVTTLVLVALVTYAFIRSAGLKP